MLCLCFENSTAQTNAQADPIIEGGKVVVELIKALTSKKELEKNQGCKGKYADLCVLNESGGSITVVLNHQITDETRELVIRPGTK